MKLDNRKKHLCCVAGTFSTRATIKETKNETIKNKETTGKEKAPVLCRWLHTADQSHSQTTQALTLLSSIETKIQWFWSKTEHQGRCVYNKTVTNDVYLNDGQIIHKRIQHGGVIACVEYKFHRFTFARILQKHQFNVSCVVSIPSSLSLQTYILLDYLRHGECQLSFGVLNILTKQAKWPP